MKLSLFIFILVFSFSRKISSAELTSASYWDGLKSSMTYFYQGSYLQFTEKNNLYVGAAAVPAIWFAFEEDQRITRHEMTKKIPKYMKITSDLAPLLSFPIIPIAFYSYGIKNDNSHTTQFAKETFATLYLALAESAALSVINIHERPKNDKLSKWETNFRGSSSFPSGHVIPFATLALKTFQFYGSYYAIAPSALFIATSLQRIRDGKHYFSDVVGAFFLTVFASEGVRKAGGYQNNSTAYKSIFERNFIIGYTEHKGTIGPKVTVDW